MTGVVGSLVPHLNLILLELIYCYYLFEWMHVPQGVCGGQRTTSWSWVSPFTFMWASRPKPRSSDLQGRQTALPRSCLTRFIWQTDTFTTEPSYQPSELHFKKCAVPSFLVCLCPIEQLFWGVTLLGRKRGYPVQGRALLPQISRLHVSTLTDLSLQIC